MKAKHWGLLAAGLYVATFTVLASTGATPAAPLALVSLIPLTAILLLAAALAFVIFGAIAVHELGHFLFGKMVKFEFIATVVGPFGLRMDKGRPAPFRVRPSYGGGYVIMHPLDEHRFVVRYALFILGGPLFSLLSLGLLLLIWHLSGIPISRDFPVGLSGGGKILHFLFGLSTVVAFTTILSSLAPYVSKSGTSSDGMKLIELAKRDGKSPRLFALMTLTRLYLSGTRVRDFPLETIRTANSIQDDSVSELLALQIRWAYELTHDRPQTADTLDQIVSLAGRVGKGVAPAWRNSISRIQATQAIFIRHDAEDGAQHLVGLPSENPHTEASTAVLCAGIAALRQETDLVAKVEAARSAIAAGSKTTSMSFDWELEWLEAMIQGWPAKSI